MRKTLREKIRYGIVGLGSISQKAVLPGFKNAFKNSEVTALISGDPIKLKEVGRKYAVPNRYSYEEYDQFLNAGVADAVYIALPNNMHSEYSIRAAKAGLHVLCEKPMAGTAQECREMITAARHNNVRLMIAYRLHFERANLNVIKIVKDGKIGKPRIFNSVFTRQVEKDDTRLKKSLDGGSVWDLGIYCLNAARYLFQEEPTHVQAVSSKGYDSRFHKVDEMTSVILSFPDGKLATFTSSFGAADTSSYEVIGTKGVIRMDPGYDYSIPLSHQLTINEKKRVFKFPKQDQFGAELLYFSDCILSNKTPEPSGVEGLIDVQIIEKIYESAKTGKRIKLPSLTKNKKRVHPDQKITLPPVKKQPLIHTS